MKTEKTAPKKDLASKDDRVTQDNPQAQDAAPVGLTFNTVETPGGVPNPLEEPQPNPAIEEETERPEAA